jgi:hypothetical protein
MADRDLAAASLLRAFMLDDHESGILILRQNGGDGDITALKELVLAVAALANRVLLSANGSDVARALAVVDQWIDGYAARAGPPV